MLYRNKKNLIPLLIAFIFLVVAMPRSARFSLDYQKGSTWKNETLVAAFDFPIIASADKQGSEPARSVIPYYKMSEAVSSENLLDCRNLPLSQVLVEQISRSLGKIYEAGILPSEQILLDNDGSLSDDLAFVQKGKHAEKVVLSNLYTEEQVWEKLYFDCLPYAGAGLDSLMDICRSYDIVESNLIYDKATTALVNESLNQDKAATDGYVKAGTVLVREGEIVTSEIYQIIESYRKEYNDTMGYRGMEWVYWAGTILISLSIVMILALLLYFTNTGIYNKFGRLCYVVTVFLLTALCSILTTSKGGNLVFAAPFTLSALYLQAFYPNKLIIPVYIVSLIPLLLFAELGPVLFVMFVLAGIVAIYLFRWFGRGWKQFVTAFATFVVLSLVYVGFYFSGFCSVAISKVLLSLFVGSMLTVAGYPLIFLFEKIFNLVSNSRLEELCDSSNGILRELEQKAPGTFQHSLQVMNMCAAAARSIGANESLLRAGALYHDIGKMLNPLCFVENESMMAEAGATRYHSGISALQSAQDIIRHVSDGADLAKKHHLPSVIEDFILTHHGTSRASFFFDKFLQEGGDSTMEADFCYAGPRPSTREQIILMLCDSAEAAARTMKDHSPESCRNLVDSLFDVKMSAGQFDDADITVREIGIIKETIINYLVQIYHERIAYPKRKNKQQ